MARTVSVKKLTIRELAFGKGYAARVQIGGSRKCFKAKTKTELRQKIADALELAADARSGIDRKVERPPESYDELCERFLATYSRRDSSKAALVSDLAASRKRFGKRAPGSISRYEAEVWDSEELAGLAPVTRRHYLGALERMLTYHSRHGWNGNRRNALEGITKERCVSAIEDEPEPDPFESWAEVFAISEAFAWRRWGQMVRFQAGLGLRPHEAIVVRACDVDLAADSFSVNRSWQRARSGNSGTEVELTKTPGSRTTVALTRIAREVLKELQAEGVRLGGNADDWRHSSLLFPDPLGRVTPLDWWRSTAWKLALAQAKVRYRGPAQLRHTFATLTLLDAGLEAIKDTSVALRHEKQATTERYYVKLVLEMKRKSARRVSAGMPSYADHTKRRTRNKSGARRSRST